MATVQIHLKEQNPFTAITTKDILCVRSANIRSIIITSPEATIYIRLSREEALTVGSQLIMHPNAVQ